MMTHLYRKPIVLVVVLLLLFGVAHLGPDISLAQGPFDPSDKTLVDQLEQITGGDLRISYHSETGKVHFIGTSPDKSVARSVDLGVNPSAEDAARGFLTTYGKLFGLADQNEELSIIQERTLADGRAFVRFQQTYQNIPIIGGELIVQTGQSRDVVSANGEVLPDLAMNVSPTISAETAQQTALALVAKDNNLNIADLSTTEPELWIHNPALMGGPGQQVNSLVWRLEVTSAQYLHIREFVLVDAQLGFIKLHFSQIHTAKNRTIYDNANNSALGLPGGGPYRTEGGAASGIADVNYAYDYSGDTYDFFFSEHGRDSLDDGGMTLISTTRYCPDVSDCPYDDAFWNGSQMVYGAGYAAADDIVGHELTHGVTDFTSHLFSYYQSGAINESLSDVWGELIDQNNGAGTDTPGEEWYIGEDLAGGAIRNMKAPPNPPNPCGTSPCNPRQPDKISSGYYYCDESDSGGVHINSGVNNKAAYLMTDGGVNVADLYYEVQTNMLTSGSNYSDLYEALIQAAINLGYSAGDQQEVKDALDAVEMSTKPCSNPTAAAVCLTGSPTYTFFDDMENIASGNWTSGASQGSNAWYYPQTSNPYSYDATYASSGVYNLWGYAQGSKADFHIAMTADVTIPANAYMHFRHYWAFEDSITLTRDGGVLEYSVDNGATWADADASPSPLFDSNGYNGTLYSNNPLGTRLAFVSESQGYTASRLNLASLSGQNVRFRYRIGTDFFPSALGWFIDDVGIYTCAAGNTAPRYLSSSFPMQGIPVNGSKDNAINLWKYVDDYEEVDNDLTFSICNTPALSGTVSIDTHYIDINLTSDWEGTADVCIRTTDTGKLSNGGSGTVMFADETFTITTRLVYLPLIVKN